jgi:tetratricopeptide (TPR) repeat protein
MANLALHRSGKPEFVAGAGAPPGATFQLGPDHPAARNKRLRRINACLEAEEYGEAERLLGRYLRERPKDPEGLASLAILLAAGRRRFASAEKAARRAIALAPRAVAGHFALGYVYLLGSRIEPGFRALMTAQELDARDPRVSFGMRRFEEVRPPVICDLSAENRLNRGLGWVRARCRGQRGAVLVLVALVAALLGITSCS